MFDFIIIGAPKASSSLLHHIIREHPNVCSSYWESPHFENDNYVADVHKLHQELTADAKPNQIIGIKRPGYLASEKCAERIAELSPDAKLLVILRDPVIRFISDYYHCVRHRIRGLPVMSIKSLSQKIQSDSWLRKYPAVQQLIDNSKYDQHLNYYYKLFESDQILVLKQELFVADIESSAYRIYDFLGIKHVTPSIPDEKPQAVCYDMKQIRILRFRNRFVFEYDKNDGMFFRSHYRRHHAFFMKNLLHIQRWIEGSSYACDDRKTLDESDWLRLYSRYEDSMRNLEKLLGHKVPWRYSKS